MRVLSTLLGVCCYLSFFGQNGEVDTVTTPDGVTHIVKSPLYPGGQSALLKDVADHFVIPKKVKKDGLHGKILLEFTIDEKGNIVDPIIVKSLREDADAAAIRMLSKLKKFTPAYQDDKPVSITYKLPIKL